MTHYQDTLNQLHQNLAILREREAKYGGTAPLDLLNQITDHEQAITLTEQLIAGSLKEAEWHDALRPLLVDIRDRSDAKPDICGVSFGDVAGDLIGTIIAGRDVRDNVINIYYQTSITAPTAEERLAAAMALLGAMPVERVPGIGMLPAGSRMAFSPNPLFVGREQELRALAQTLKLDGTVAIGQIAAATGLGGIGKTQLATEFVHRYGQYFAGGVFWLNMAEAGTVPAEVAACGGLGGMNLAGLGELKLEEQVQVVCREWQSPVPRLLVFDNCEEEELLTEWRPRTGGCKVVVTSRRGQWQRSLGVQAVRLGVLGRTESVEMLGKYRPDLGERPGELAALAEELGDLPLALHLAGSYLESNQGDGRLGDPARLLTRLREKQLLGHPALAGEDLSYSPTNHSLHVGRTFALSYEQLKPERARDELARQVVGRAAYFAPGTAIPRDLLALTVKLAEDEDEAAGQMNQALARLVGLGLVEQDEAGGVVLHRLVAHFVRRELGEAAVEAQAAVEAAVLSEASRVNKAGYPGPLLGWQGHLRFVTEAALAREDERGADLAETLLFHLNMVGDYAGAIGYAEQALAIREKSLGPEHPDTASSLNNLGYLLQAMGDTAGARPYLERALAIREKSLGPEHPDTARSLNNLGMLLQDMGDTAGARPYLEQALAIREKSLGPEHPATASSLNNLGMLLQAMGDSAGARPYLEQALAIREKSLGPEHPDTASSLNNLGYLLQAMGDSAGARPYFERALAIREKSLGPEHPDTASSLNNLGYLLKAMGDTAGARPYFERALAITEKSLGPEHPATARSLNNLGSLLQDMGDTAGARPYYERALAIYEKSLGPEHPDTALSLNNLGYLLKAMGDTAGARPYFERALAITEKSLGPEHPDTASSLNNLGYLLKAMGDTAGARPYYERALAIYEKSLGPEHPATALSLNNLGSLLQAMGDNAGARPYYERALAIYEKSLGPEHPDTASSLNNLGSLLQAMGDTAGARPYLERALAITEKSLGPEHPDTARSLNNLGMLLQDMGDTAGARPYYERALAITEKSLGPEHPHTRVVRGNLEGLGRE